MILVDGVPCELVAKAVRVEEVEKGFPVIIVF
jgi:hypothetical protein